MSVNVYANVLSGVSPLAGQDLQGSVWHTCSTTGASPWFAVQVRSQCEMRTHQELALRGVDSYLPLRQVKRRWSDRTKLIDVPIFPGYLFCKFELSDRFHVLNAPGVARIVGAGSTPIAIPEIEITSIRTMVESKTVLVPWPYLKSGQRVRIDRGPLSGVEGLVVKAPDGNPRVVVSVDLLQRSIAAEIDREWIGCIQ